MWFKLSTLVKWVAKKVSNADEQDWDTIVEAVVSAEKEYYTNEDKARFVKEVAASLLTITSGWVLNLLVELALAYAKDKGYLDK